MHSQLPTISLYLNSYTRSPSKYNPNESTLMASPQKNKMTAVDSSIISPMRDVNVSLNRNLSSLILMPTPIKAPPQTERKESLDKNQGKKEDVGRDSSVEVKALNLTASIFMNSTTKFLKGFADAVNESIEESLPSLQRQQTSIWKKEPNPLKIRTGNNIQQRYSFRKICETTGAVPVVYPSREKIQKIVRGQSNKKSQLQNNASQRLQQTLSRNRVTSERSHRNANKNESQSEHSRSGSFQRLSRRKSRTRELKFLQKKQRSETSITLKEAQKATSAMPNAVKPQLKGQKNNSRTAVNEIKSADTKRTEETTRPSARQTGTKPLPNTRPAQKDIENTPSILSNISEQKAPAKHKGFKPIFTLPSGQLPLQTPVKPPPPLLRNESNKSNDPTIHKPINKVKNQLASQISAIKEEKTADVQSKPSAKSKQIVFHGSVKEETSTYMHQNPTEVVVCAGNQNVVSKLAKNQSTKAIGLSTVSKYSSNKNIKPQQKFQETKTIQASKSTTKKPQSSKSIPLEPIPSSPSLLSDKRSPQPSTISKRNLKSGLKEDLSSKISIEDRTLTNQGETTKKIEQKQVSVNKNKRLFAITQTIVKLYARNLVYAFQKMRMKSKSAKLHSKEASILISQANNVYHNLYRNNLRTSLEQLKRLSLSNPNNKKPALTLNKSTGMAASIIFRIITSKYREGLQFLKNDCLKNQPQPSISHKQIKILEKQSHNKPYLLLQLAKIVQKYHNIRIQNSLARLVLHSANQRKNIQKQTVPLARSPPKFSKPSRDYSSQKIALSQQKQSLQYQISRVQWRISDKKRFVDRQKSKLLKKQEDLMKKNKAMDGEVLEKRQKNKYLKEQLERSGINQQFDIPLLQCEPFIQILTDIYSTVFRQGQQTFDVGPLVQKHSLAKQDQNSLQEEWQALALNVTLKSEIGQWEGAGKAHRSKQILLAEQQLIGKVLRSYMRERYLWQWVRVAAQAL